MKIQLGLTRKLFLAFLLMAALLLAALAGAFYWSFQRGFLDYLGQLELEGLDPLAQTLVAAHDRFGSWDWIRGDGALWRELVDATDDDADGPQRRVPPEAGRPPHARPPEHPRNGRPGPPPARLGAGAPRWDQHWPPPRPTDDPDWQGFPPWPQRQLVEATPTPGLQEGPADDDSTEDAAPARPPAPPPRAAPELLHRLTLLDADRTPIIGPRAQGLDTLLRPLKSHGEVIGWLRLAPRPGLTDALDLDFQRRQLRLILGAAAAALLLAILLAIPLSRHLLGPIRTLTRSMAALTSGRFDTRTRIRRADELGQLSAGFNRLAETLEHNETLRRRWVAEVSHELRTPLAVVTGELDAIVEGIRPWDRDSQASLRAELARLNKLVDDLHQLALSDLGALSYRKEVLALEPLIEAALERHESRLDAAGLQLETDLATPPSQVLADADRLAQLLDNLLENCLRYTEHGGRVGLRTSRREGSVLIEMQDSAPGVPQDALPRLFERLYRVDKSRSRAKGGAGLGLAIVRNIVEAHGGRIEARHSPLGGLGISISLPLGSR